MSASPAVEPVDELPFDQASEQEQLQSTAMRVTIGVFVVVPFLALLAAIPVAWGGWLSWTDVAIAAVFWAFTGLGITVGYHRYFTHGSFKAPRAVKIALALAGGLALEGSVTQWVADHRRHHRYSDELGDPHSPWRYGTSTKAVAKGFWFSHIGWLFDEGQTPIEQYAPDIVADRDLVRIGRWFPALVVASLLLPALIGGLLTWSIAGALTAFFWAGLVRVAVVHHVTWAVNSVCHITGKRQFRSRDLSTNVWWLAVPTFGESWHSLHHAEPTSARHGVLRGQLDVSAEVIRLMEATRLAHDVRWPKPERVERKLADPALAHRIRRSRSGR